MNHIFSLILLFKSSDSTENEMIIDDKVNPCLISGWNVNYKPLGYKLLLKNTEDEIKNY